MIYVGIDWGEASHAVCLLSEDGTELGRRRIPESIEGVRTLHLLIAQHTLRADAVVIGIETEHGLLVRALVATGYQVYAINPCAASRYRDRHTTSGSKSDPGDAKVLADLVRTDRHNHRPIAGDSEQVAILQVVTRAHQRLIQDRTRHVNQLRSLLQEYYPGALRAFGNHLQTPEALAILLHAPTPQQGQALSQKQLVGLLRRAGRQRALERSATAIQAALRRDLRSLPPPVAAAYGQVALATVRILVALNQQIMDLEGQIASQFEVHPDAEIIASLPGLGSTLGARVLAEFGDDRTRYADSSARKCYAGTAPITRTSGRKRTVQRRRATNTWLQTTCSLWAFSALTASPGAARAYRAHRARGASHNQALRALGNRLVGILHGCLAHRRRYDEAVAWPRIDTVDHQREPASDQNKSRKMTGSRPGSSHALRTSA